jgi:hypothetical protein
MGFKLDIVFMYYSSVVICLFGPLLFGEHVISRPGHYLEFIDIVLGSSSHRELALLIAFVRDREDNSF